MEKFRKPMLIACGGFIILFIFMFIMGSCSKKNYTSEEFVEYLLKEAKNYYQIHKDALPQVDTGKTSLSIAVLVEDTEKFLEDDNICNGSIDVINNNGYYMYIPNIQCSDNYSTTKLSDTLTLSDNIVSSGNGLYQVSDYYIYRGENVNNFVVFDNKLWRIVRINNDGSLRMIETNYSVTEKNGSMKLKSSKRASVVWDNRYNTEKSYTAGFNDFVHDGLNSRIKDSLEEIYNDFDDNIKGYIVKQNLCIGKRSLNDTVNDGSIECSNILADQYVGLLQLNEYINASLDPSCVSAESVTCANYNYISTFKSTFWTITGVKDNSYDVYKIGTRISDSTANSSSMPRIVIHLSSEARINAGTGTEEDPYIIK